MLCLCHGACAMGGGARRAEADRSTPPVPTPSSSILPSRESEVTTFTSAAASMSPAVEEAQAQWFEQLHAMRKAIAELGLPADVEEAPAYGHDIDFDDYDDISGTASGEDIWDIISDEYEEGYSSDHLDEFARAPAASNTYDEQWLVAKCSQVARSSSGLDAEALKEQIAAVLSSDSNGQPGSNRLHPAMRLTRSR